MSQSASLNTTFHGRTILVTGHTGFKGAWLTLWLHKLGAKVHGLSLAEAPSPAAFTALGGRKLLASERLADVRDPTAVSEYIAEVQPEIIFHLAAQALVRESYQDPLKTLTTNFMGTAHILEALRRRDQKCACIVVTSDKCYQNREADQAYRETDAMGGHDVYSMSKGASELLVASYRHSFFIRGKVALASARAGNVVGGGDYADDRIVPDCVRALSKGKPIAVRNPEAIRPWQHVLEPLAAYLMLAGKLLGSDAHAFSEAWNFGPTPKDNLTVKNFVKTFIASWGSGTWEQVSETQAPHEAQLLKLDIDKAATRLGWTPTWEHPRAIQETVAWYRKFEQSSKQEGVMQEFSLEQIGKFDAARR